MSPLASWAFLLYWVGFAVTLVQYPSLVPKHERSAWRWIFAVFFWPVFWAVRVTK